MSSFRLITILIVILLACFALSASASSSGSVIYFNSLDSNHPYKLSGTLYMPDNNSGPCPAIVMVHGTAGINETGAFYRDSILQAGIAVFEVNFKTGVYTGPSDRPPADTLVPMGFAALKELRKLQTIDPNRIGIMGFSMGGHLTVNTAFETNRKLWMGADKSFASFVAFYPVCKSFLYQSDVRLTGAPMIIFYGTDDCYGEGQNVPAFKRLILSKDNIDIPIVEYAGAHHDFNRNHSPLNYYDPAAINGKGYTEWDAEAANDSLTRVIDFLNKTLNK
jgi:dienelactone hydrolase